MPFHPSTRAVLAWLLAVLLPIFAIIPALTNPIEDYAIDTAAFHIYRAVVFSEARAEGGGFLPRWTQPTNGGLGGPLFAYTPTLMYFLMDGFHALGLDYVYTWRAVTALMLVIASLGMFGFGRALFRRTDAAFLGTAAFVYAPMLLRDFFERGSPQATGVALFPWVLWAVLRLARRPSGVRFALAAVAWGLLVFAHNLSALLLAPVIGLLVIAAVWGAKNEGYGTNPGAHTRLRSTSAWAIRELPLPMRRGGVVLLALAAGSLLVAFYAFPVFAELQYIQIDNPKHTTHAYPPDNPSRFSEIVNTPPVFDTGLGNNTMGLSLGLLQFSLSGVVIIAWPLTMLFCWVWFRRRRVACVLSRYHMALGAFVVGLGLLSALTIWLQLESATPVWRALSFLDVLQFRFRLLSLATLTGAISLGGLIVLFGNLPHESQERLTAENAENAEETKGKTKEIQAESGSSSDVMVAQRDGAAPGKLSAAAALILTIIVVALALVPLHPDLMHRYNTLEQGLTAEDVKRQTIQANTASLAAFNEYVPIWRHMPFTLDEMQRAAESPIANLPAGARITQDARRTGHWQIGIDTPEAFTAAFYLLYYPGWEARIDGARREIRPAEDNTGYLLLDVPKGNHTITLDYAGTTAQRIGDWTSLVAALALAEIALVWRPALTPTSGDDGRRGAFVHIEKPPMRAITYPAPRTSLIAVGAILLLAGVKTLWIDDTTLLLHTSTCESIHAVDRYPPVEFGAYRLCGYRLNETAFRAGDTLVLDLYWQIDAPVDRPATTFAHVVGDAFNPRTGTPVWGERDHRTPGGHPTSDWGPGKLYRDTFRITIPDHTPPATYQIEIGWTNWDDGARIPPAITAPESAIRPSEWDSLLLAEITIQ